MFRYATLLLMALAISAQAALVQGNLAAGDGMLVTDTATGIDWVKPFLTRGETYNDAVVQGLETTYGLHYATEQQVVDMIDNNFGNPPVGSPGSTAGWQDVEDFFNVFGINQNGNCGNVPCPRTQGLTSTLLPSNPGTHAGVGMIQLGTNGWMIQNNPWPDTGFVDFQMGSWLIRGDSAPATPEPGTTGLIGGALTFVGLLLRKRRRAD